MSSRYFNVSEGYKGRKNGVSRAKYLYRSVYLMMFGRTGCLVGEEDNHLSLEAEVSDTRGGAVSILIPDPLMNERDWRMKKKGMQFIDGIFASPVESRQLDKGSHTIETKATWNGRGVFMAIKLHAVRLLANPNPQGVELHCLCGRGTKGRASRMSASPITRRLPARVGAE